MEAPIASILLAIFPLSPNSIQIQLTAISSSEISQKYNCA